MKAKSIIRRIELLEKRLMPKQEDIGVMILDHVPTDEELAELRNKYGNVPIIFEDRLPP